MGGNGNVDERAARQRKRQHEHWEGREGSAGCRAGAVADADRTAANYNLLLDVSPTRDADGLSDLDSHVVRSHQYSPPSRTFADSGAIETDGSYYRLRSDRAGERFSVESLDRVDGNSNSRQTQLTELTALAGREQRDRVSDTDLTRHDFACFDNLGQWARVR